MSRDLLRYNTISHKTLRTYTGKAQSMASLLYTWRPFISMLWAALYDKSNSLASRGQIWTRQVTQSPYLGSLRFSTLPRCILNDRFLAISFSTEVNSWFSISTRQLQALVGGFNVTVLRHCTRLGNSTVVIVRSWVWRMLGLKPNNPSKHLRFSLSFVNGCPFTSITESPSVSEVTIWQHLVFSHACSLSPLPYSWWPGR